MEKFLNILMNEINQGKGLFRAAFSVTQYPFGSIGKVRVQGTPPCLFSHSCPSLVRNSECLAFKSNSSTNLSHLFYNHLKSLHNI